MSRHQANLAKDLQVLAYKLTHEGDDDDADDWRMTLMTSVDKLLDAGEEATLASALKDLISDPRAHDFLEVLVRRAAPRARKDSEDGASTGQLIAVPVLLTSQPLPGNSNLGDGALDAFASSLKTFGLAHPEVSTVAAGYLYLPQNLLSLAATQIRQLSKALLTASRMKAGIDLASQAGSVRPGWPPDSPAAHQGLLCYVLLLVSDDQGREEVDTSRLLQAKWLQPAGALLAHALGVPADTVAVLDIAPFNEGLRLGSDAFADFEARCSSHKASGADRLDPEDVAAFVDAYRAEKDKTQSLRDGLAAFLSNLGLGGMDLSGLLNVESRSTKTQSDDPVEAFEQQRKSSPRNHGETHD